MRLNKLMVAVLLLTANFSLSAADMALPSTAIAQELGWISSEQTRCGGYYVEPPFTYAKELLNNSLIKITSDEMLFAQHGTSISQGKVTITRFGQQIIANKAYLYRDPTTGKLSVIELVDDVVLREPNNLVVAKNGRFDLKTKGQSLQDIVYRTTIYSKEDNSRHTVYQNEDLQVERHITRLSAWGKAQEFRQEKPKIYEFNQATYSTCPPTAGVWQVKAQRIKLNRDIGRGIARHARVYVKGIPLFYTPYLNFPIDDRRQTGFLAPTLGTSSKTGGYLRTPFYWNIAPNYDSTVTPALLTKRGLELSNSFRYLTTTSQGTLSAAILPHDQAFDQFKTAYQNQYQNSTNPFIQAELQQLQNANNRRGAIYWKNDTRVNEHWSGDLDYSYVSDDYYLTDLNTTINEVTQNQLLQQAQLNYQNPHWKVLSRIQAYQTLHPVDQNTVQNQYRRLPQIVIDGDYPNMAGGLDYFVTTDITHFGIKKTPGSSTSQPIGNRLNVQPGLALPFTRPYLYFVPRLQLAMTQYELSNVPSDNPTHPNRHLPIFDIHSGLYFDRNTQLFHTAYRQTLEPQIYYTYVPYKNQNDLPIFDTIVNTLTYDELFMYNRFSGLDRISDANQMSYGLATRLIDQQAGYEKFKAGVGQIFYFKSRKVTLCSTDSAYPCDGIPTPSINKYNKSPISAILSYGLNAAWNVSGSSIWDAQKNQLNNQTITLHYQPASQRIVNISYSYVRGGDILAGDLPNSNASNLSQTDVSLAWPISRDWSSVARWTQNWNHHHFQNMLYGLQYDSCCWAVRFVTGRTFTNLSPNNTYQYNTEFFFQFALKGLGNYGNADPGSLLSSSISGYHTNFGQDYAND